MSEIPPVDETITWLRNRSYYASQIQDHRVVAGQDATCSDLDVHRAVDSALKQQDIPSLYKHQVDAIQAVRDGKNVVLATPTASGKSLAYTIPALERAIERNETTLYLAPKQALINDQHETLSEFAASLGFDASVDVGMKTGATDDRHNRQIKRQQPDILLATIDQLHFSLIPYAHSADHWKWLFQQLGTVVLDEVHQYRGNFGTHTGLILRRFTRLTDYYDVEPEFVCCSATIGNPVDHAATVTGQPPDSFALVDSDTSATGDRHWLIWNPPLKKEAAEKQSPGISEIPEDPDEQVGSEIRAGHDPQPPEQLQSDPAVPETSVDGGEVSVDLRAVTDDSEGTLDERESGDQTRALPAHDEVAGGDRRSQHAEAVRLFCDLVTRGYQTLVFTRARQGTEQYAAWAEDMLRKRGQRELTDNIHAYHAGLYASDRRKIEAGLRDGTARGVWSTNALEVGIDIGTLDVVLLDGYPGTLMETFQRAGRAGRGDDQCLVVVVGGDDPLDQYMVSHPDELFEGNTEDATLNPANRAIQLDHLVCAAADHYLEPDDETYFEGDVPTRVAALVDHGRLRRTDEDRIRWTASEDNVQWNTEIRSIDDISISIVDRHTETQVGKLPLSDALRDVHPEAIYMYRGQSYQVVELDIPQQQAVVEKTNTSAYTRALREKQIKIQDTLQTDTICLTESNKTTSDDINQAGPGDGQPVTIQKTLADLSVVSCYENYLYYSHPSDDNPEEREIPESLPPHEIETRGLFIEIPAPIESVIREAAGAENGYLAALHATEHTLISLFPSAVLCDRGDIGGLSIKQHPQTIGGTIIVHDAYEGGAGYSRAAYDQLGRLLERTYERIRTCGCENGCPSCIHSPQCGNANRTLSKSLARVLLGELS